MTGYDPAGSIVEWGKSDMSRIARLLYAADRLQSRWSQPDLRAKKRKGLKKAGARLRQKVLATHLTLILFCSTASRFGQVRDLISDCHRRLVKYLCESYDFILLPSFETSQMVNTRGSRKRKINSDTVRKMLTWRHYDFKQRLLNKAREYPWVRIKIVTEEYTSKTCTGCGWINDKLGGNKMYKCKSCGTALDRDFNGARNIFLKNERDHIPRCGLAPS
jgi:putative transposase